MTKLVDKLGGVEVYWGTSLKRWHSARVHLWIKAWAFGNVPFARPLCQSSSRARPEESVGVLRLEQVAGLHELGERVCRKCWARELVRA